jgi:hypothetical protein
MVNICLPVVVIRRMKPYATHAQADQHACGAHSSDVQVQKWPKRLPNIKDLYQVLETLKKLCEFSTVWADRADLGSQKLFSKLTSIFPRKTHDNFQFNIQKITQVRKRWSPLFLNHKRNVGSSQWLNKVMDLNHKTYFLDQ